MTLTTLQRHCPSDFYLHSFAASLRRAAKTAGKASTINQSVWGPRHVKALEELAEYVETISLTDPRAWSLWLAAGLAGRDQDRYAGTGERSNELLHRLAMGPDTPDPADTVAELIGAGLEDIQTRIQSMGRESQDQRARADELAAEVDRLRTAEAEAESARGELDRARAERDEAFTQRDYLDSILDNRPAPAKSARPRRVRVEGHVGVYSRPSKAEGEPLTYEITWTDPGGKQRWKTIGPDIEEAKAERARLVAHTPEEVAA